MWPMDFAATGAFPAHLPAVPGVRTVPIHPTRSAASDSARIRNRALSTRRTK